MVLFMSNDDCFVVFSSLTDQRTIMTLMSLFVLCLHKRLHSTIEYETVEMNGWTGCGMAVPYVQEVLTKYM